MAFTASLASTVIQHPLFDRGMWSQSDWFKRPIPWPPVLLFGVGTSVFYTGLVLFYTLLPFSNVDIGDPIWQTAGFSALMSLGVVGVPVVLWGRYRLYGPLALMSFILVFWHVLVEFPPIGSGQGDSPGFLFVFLLAPVYVALYAVIGILEFKYNNGKPLTLLQ